MPLKFNLMANEPKSTTSMVHINSWFFMSNEWEVSSYVCNNSPSPWQRGLKISMSGWFLGHKWSKSLCFQVQPAHVWWSFGFFFINLKYISYMTLKWLVLSWSLYELQVHRSVKRATSPTSQEPWPWNCESPKESVQRPSKDTSKIM